MTEISNRLALNPNKVLENVPYSDWTEKLYNKFADEQNRLEKIGKSWWQKKIKEDGKVARGLYHIPTNIL